MFGLSVDDLAYLIAIVDDEKEEGERIKGLVQKYFEGYPDKTYEVSLYQDGGQLMAELAQQRYFDLYFLDVEMVRQENGIELAHSIRFGIKRYALTSNASGAHSR